MEDRLLVFATDSNLAVTVLCALSFAAVFVPFYRGLATSLRAWGATSRSPVRGAPGAAGPGAAPPYRLAELLSCVVRKSLEEDSRELHPMEFILDASKQYVAGEYQAHYAQVISMYANLLPPLGFIGTVTGLFILLFSRSLANESLELGALALALTSTIFALVAFAVLEGLKIRLHARLQACLGDVLARERSAGRRAAARRPTTSGAA